MISLQLKAQIPLYKSRSKPAYKPDFYQISNKPADNWQTVNMSFRSGQVVDFFDKSRHYIRQKQWYEKNNKCRVSEQLTNRKCRYDVEIMQQPMHL